MAHTVRRQPIRAEPPIRPWPRRRARQRGDGDRSRGRRRGRRAVLHRRSVWAERSVVAAALEPTPVEPQPRAARKREQLVSALGLQRHRHHRAANAVRRRRRPRTPRSSRSRRPRVRARPARGDEEVIGEPVQEAHNRRFLLALAAAAPRPPRPRFSSSSLAPASRRPPRTGSIAVTVRRSARRHPCGTRSAAAASSGDR